MILAWLGLDRHTHLDDPDSRLRCNRHPCTALPRKPRLEFLDVGALAEVVEEVDDQGLAGIGVLHVQRLLGQRVIPHLGDSPHDLFVRVDGVATEPVRPPTAHLLLCDLLRLALANDVEPFLFRPEALFQGMDLVDDLAPPTLARCLDGRVDLQVAF